MSNVEKEFNEFSEGLRELGQRKQLDDIKANLKAIAKEDSRDADLVTDGTEDILRGRAELAEEILDQLEKNNA